MGNVLKHASHSLPRSYRSSDSDETQWLVSVSRELHYDVTVQN